MARSHNKIKREVLSMKGDFYLLYLAIISTIGGAYAVIKHDLTDDPTLNIQMGIAFLAIGVILLWLFYKTTKTKN
ncbi:MAG TPA: hypothetical protein VFW78_06630 [Bacteroidia bacterium]|nr:hypothetical protein [Bacteroidia bacterium]